MSNGATGRAEAVRGAPCRRGAGRDQPHTQRAAPGQEDDPLPSAPGHRESGAEPSARGEAPAAPPPPRLQPRGRPQREALGARPPRRRQQEAAQAARRSPEQVPKN